MKKAAVILGAGASFDSWSGVGPQSDPQWRPPLAKHLFGIHQTNPAFWKILKNYPDAEFLAHELGTEAERGSLDLETKLRELANHPNPLISKKFRQLPLYLRDVLHKSSNDWLEGLPGTYVQLVKRLLCDVEHRVLFLVLNYDTLLEKVLQRVNSGLGIDGTDYERSDFSLYVNSTRQALVVKPHGSIDWFVPIGAEMSPYDNTIRNHGNYLNVVHDADIMAPLQPVYIMSNMAENPIDNFVYHTPNGKRWLYPVLTSPLAGKSKTDLVCPSSHIDALKVFLKECEKLLVIGYSGLDENVLDLLAESEFKPKIVHYVGDPQVYLTSERFHKGVPSSADCTEVNYENGFRNYVSHRIFTQFLEK